MTVTVDSMPANCNLVIYCALRECRHSIEFSPWDAIQRFGAKRKLSDIRENAICNKCGGRGAAIICQYSGETGLN